MMKLEAKQIQDKRDAKKKNKDAIAKIEAEFRSMPDTAENMVNKNRKLVEQTSNYSNEITTINDRVQDLVRRELAAFKTSLKDAEVVRDAIANQEARISQD